MKFTLKNLELAPNFSLGGGGYFLIVTWKLLGSAQESIQVNAA